MRAFATDLFHLILNPPLALFLLLSALAVLGYRQRTSFTSLRRVFVAAAAITYLGCTPLISNQVATLLESRYPLQLPSETAGNKPIILVLTDGWFRRAEHGYEAHIGEAGWERLEAAIELHKRIGGWLLITGAPSPDGGSSIAEVMAEVMRRMGVAKGQILVETRAQNTYENILLSKPFVPRDAAPVWLVTSALHMPRAMAVAERQGFRVIAYPCDFRSNRGTSWRAWIPSTHGAVAMERSLHEIFGLAIYRWRGWV
jgi:uncharacterized SAM-binding protein YcdF (DUF218 family)